MTILIIPSFWTTDRCSDFHQTIDGISIGCWPQSEHSSAVVREIMTLEDMLRVHLGRKAL